MLPRVDARLKDRKLPLTCGCSETFFSAAAIVGMFQTNGAVHGERQLDLLRQTKDMKPIRMTIHA